MANAQNNTRKLRDDVPPAKKRKPKPGAKVRPDGNERLKNGKGNTAQTPENEEHILTELMMGRTLKDICSNDEGMPAVNTVMYWVLNDSNGFRKRYRMAREAQGMGDADRTRATMAKLERGEIDANAARVIINGLQWLAERQSPKHYGAKTQTDLTSSDGSMTPKPALDVSKLSTAALQEIMAAADGKSQSE